MTLHKKYVKKKKDTFKHATLNTSSLICIAIVCHILNVGVVHRGLSVLSLTQMQVSASACAIEARITTFIFKTSPNLQLIKFNLVLFI